MLILYCGMKYDYGKPAQGYSFEHYNFYDSLVNMGHDILYFDFMTLMQEHGRSWMNRRLLEVVRSEKPALVFTILFTDEIEKKTVRAISESGETTTLNWFCDDHWRFESYSRGWAPCFNWVVTTAESAYRKCEDLGYSNVIKSQWACNHYLYRKLDLPLVYDVTFVGRPHRIRRALIECLRRAGIEVQTWGNGWDRGRISQEQMIRIFNQSRINLNLSNASVALTGSLSRSVKGMVNRLLGLVYGGSTVRRAGSNLLAAARWLGPLGRTSVGINTRTAPTTDQIKGRNFEVPGCGGFLLTGKADNMEEYYRIGEEVACFDSTDELVEKIRFYLADEDWRNTVALAGHQRTLKEHTYAHRFSEIFETMGLAAPAAELLLAEPGRPGVTREIT